MIASVAAKCVNHSATENQQYCRDVEHQTNQQIVHLRDDSVVYIHLSVVHCGLFEMS